MDFSTPQRNRSDSTAERLGNLRLDDFSLSEIDTNNIPHGDNHSQGMFGYGQDENLSLFELNLKADSVFEDTHDFPVSSSSYAATTPFFGTDERQEHFPVENSLFKDDLSFLKDNVSVKEAQSEDLDYLEGLLPDLPDLSTDISLGFRSSATKANQHQQKLLKTPTKSTHRFSRARKSPLAARNFRSENADFVEEPISPKKRPRRKKCAPKNKKCTIEGCSKNARGNTGLCVKHGGGKRCKHPECRKGARPYSDFCSKHGGGRRCKITGCKKGALNKSDYCRKHGRELEVSRDVTKVGADIAIMPEPRTALSQKKIYMS